MVQFKLHHYLSLAFVDLFGFTHVRFGTHDRSDHFALPEIDDQQVILVEMLCP